MSASRPTAKGDDPLAILAKFRTLVRAAQRHSAAIQKQCGISSAQLWMLEELRAAPGLRVGELATRMAFHQSTTSNLIDSLERRGYVVKSRDEGDQRVVNLSLSPSGARVLRKAPQPARGLLPEALARVAVADLAGLDAGLRALLDVIDDADQEAGAKPLSFNL